MESRDFYEKKAVQVPHATYYEAVEPYSRYINQRRITLVTTMAEKYGAGKALILDFGCGDGHIDRAILKTCSKVIGVDISLTRLKRANELISEGRFVPVVADLTAIPFKDGCAELILCSSTLDHIPDPITALLQMKRLLRPDGKLLVELGNIFKLTKRRIRINKPVLDKNGHCNHFDYLKFKRLIKKVGLSEIDRASFGAPFNKYGKWIRKYPVLDRFLDYIGQKMVFLSSEYIVVLDQQDENCPCS